MNEHLVSLHLVTFTYQKLGKERFEVKFITGIH